MNLVTTLEKMMMVGSEWILYLLILLSVLIVAISIERVVYLQKTKVNFKEFCLWLSRSLMDEKYSEIEQRCASEKKPETLLVREVLQNRKNGSDALENHMNLLINGARQDMDRGLLVIGTVGSNAPFIGLLGTVFGVIQAFHQLSLTGAGGNSAVMAGISEALVATGIGLLVAIPAVVLFNAFQRTVKTRVANLDALKNLLLADVKRLELKK